MNEWISGTILKAWWETCGKHKLGQSS